MIFRKIKIVNRSDVLRIAPGTWCTLCGFISGGAGAPEGFVSRPDGCVHV